MKNTINKFLLVVSIAVITACGNSKNSDEVNYFSQSGLVTPTFNNEKLDSHLKSFETIYNDLASSAKANNKDADNLNELSIAYSDWILESLKLKEQLPAEEQKKLNDYVESTTKPWNAQKDKLF